MVACPGMSEKQSCPTESGQLELENEPRTGARPVRDPCPAAWPSSRVGEKTTKTDAVKHVPVHPTLAAMLAECSAGGPR